MTLQPQIQGLVRGLVTPFLTDRERTLDRELAEVQEKASFRGVGLGSPVVVESFDVVAAEAERRVGYVWGSLKRVLQSGRVTLYDGLIEDIESEIRSYREEVMSDIEGRFEELAIRNQVQLGPKMNLSNRWTEAVEKFMAEARLELFSVKSEAELAGYNTTIHFHGPVGAFQSGPSAVAHVTQNIDQHALGELQAILDQLVDRLDSLTVAPIAGQEIRAAVSVSKTELSKAKPDWAKLLGATNAIVGLAAKLPEFKDVYYRVLGWVSAHLPPTV